MQTSVILFLFFLFTVTTGYILPEVTKLATVSKFHNSRLAALRKPKQGVYYFQTSSYFWEEEYSEKFGLINSVSLEDTINLCNYSTDVLEKTRREDFLKVGFCERYFCNSTYDQLTMNETKQFLNKNHDDIQLSILTYCLVCEQTINDTLTVIPFFFSLLDSTLPLGLLYLLNYLLDVVAFSYFFISLHYGNSNVYYSYLTSRFIIEAQDILIISVILSIIAVCIAAVINFVQVYIEAKYFTIVYGIMFFAFDFIDEFRSSIKIDICYKVEFTRLTIALSICIAFAIVSLTAFGFTGVFGGISSIFGRIVAENMGVGMSATRYIAVVVFK
eukprot:gene653-8155_t